MYIKSLYIESFAGVKNKGIEFSRGLNIVEGNNESGKSTVCMFIKFMFYGLSGRGSDGDISERQRYIPWDTRKAAGTLTVVSAKGEYKIERELSVFEGSQAKEHLCIIDLYTGEQVHKGEVPGVCLLGVDEQMFVNTVFVRQIGGTEIDGSGMAEAIENILLTGDESLSVKRAVERLEKIRKALMPKKGTGGKIQMLIQEEARLSQKLEDAKHSNAAVIAYENESAKLAALIEKRTGEKNRFDGLCRAYKTIEAARRLEKARELENRIVQLGKKLETLEKLGDLSERSAKINALSAKLAGVESRLKGLRSNMGELPNENDRMSDYEIEDARDDIDNAKSAKDKKNLFTILLSIMYVLCGGVFAAAFVFKKALSQSMFIAACASAGFFFVLGAVFTVISIVGASKLSKILKRWDSRNVLGLETDIERRIIRASMYAKAAEDLERKTAETNACEEEKNAVIHALRSECREFTGEGIADVSALTAASLERIQELSKTKESLNASLAMSKGEMRGFADVLGYDNGESVERAHKEVMQTELGQTASGFTTKDAAMAISKKNFAESALPGLITQKGDVDANLARVRATTEDTAVLSAQLDGTRREITALKNKLVAVEEAASALVAAGEGIRASLMPRVVDSASVILSAFTAGKHKAVFSDRNFALSFMVDERKRAISQMSAGTQDAAYVSFRCAIAKVLFSTDVPPLVYDESFARIDEERLGGILEMLSESKMQSLVFTCRSLEGAIADRLESGTRIRL